MSSTKIINIHTPSSSFAIIHSINEESIQQLFDKLSRKQGTDFHGHRVGPGWTKYHWNDTFWNLDDDADYSIFVWRRKSSGEESSAETTLYIQNPLTPLPEPPAYRNPSFYLFSLTQSKIGLAPRSPKTSFDVKSRKSAKKKKAATAPVEKEEPKHKKEFEKFHSENGVRTVMGSIGPVQNGTLLHLISTVEYNLMMDVVRMLLKAGYRHVYISRKFAMKHGFIPADAAPGHYGYGGLVNIGTWPITLQPLGASALDLSSADHPPAFQKQGDHGNGNRKGAETKSILIPVYLSEEPHFDVVLGRSFFEKRRIQTNPTDPTEVVCLDTGERIEVEVVVLKDGRGEIVIVT